MKILWLFNNIREVGRYGEVKNNIFENKEFESKSARNHSIQEILESEKSYSILEIMASEKS